MNLSELPHASYRRLFGLVLGTLIGMAFTLVSQTINLLALPGVPLYQPPFGPLGNILAGTLFGALLGIVTAWAETGARGVFISSMLCALAVAIPTLLSGRTDSEVIVRKITAVILIFVPTAAFLSLLVILARWTMNREEIALRDSRRGDPPPLLARYALPAMLVLAAGLLGMLFRYNDTARTVTRQMQELILLGQKAQDSSALPAPLQPPNVEQFFSQGRGAFTLQWDRDESNRYAIPRPASGTYDSSIVIARFKNGYLLVCMFPDRMAVPECRDFY